MADINTAFVLGAGLGTRLLPLTEQRPKPLVPVFNKPLITFGLDHLLDAGIQKLIINTHHAAEAYPRILGGTAMVSEYAGHRLFLRHEPQLLDTGGGIKNIRDFTGDQPFLVYNGDVLTDVPLGPLIQAHLDSGNVATLLLRSAGGPAQVQWNATSGLVEDIRQHFGSSVCPGFLFSGIHAFSPEIFSWLPDDDVFSIFPVWLRLIEAGRLGGVLTDGGLWHDLGQRDAYLKAHEMLARLHFQMTYPMHWPLERIANGVELPADCRMDEFSALGAGCRVGSGATLTRSILWPGAEIASGAHLDHCIVRDGMIAAGRLENTDL